MSTGWFASIFCVVFFCGTDLSSAGRVHVMWSIWVLVRFEIPSVSSRAAVCQTTTEIWQHAWTSHSPSALLPRHYSPHIEPVHLSSFLSLLGDATAWLQISHLRQVFRTHVNLKPSACTAPFFLRRPGFGHALGLAGASWANAPSSS